MGEPAEQAAEDPGLPEAGMLRPWQVRFRRAEAVMDAFQEVLRSDETGEDEAARFLAGLDTQSHVGSRHHTVPRFLLKRWADKSLQVQTYSRIEGRFATRNVNDLAIKDFYTFIDLAGRKDSSMESILSVGVEKPADAVLNDLLGNPFAAPSTAQVSDLATLAQFAAFQVVRTARHRREGELHAEWLAKTMAQGQIADARLREIVVTPHQNDAIRRMGEAAYQFMGLFACRPLALVLLDRPRLLIGDDPVLVNPGPKDDTHVADCFLTDAQISARMARERRKKKGRRRRQVGRIVHFSSTVPRGLGVALEIVLPVSPRAALLWGPLNDTPYTGDIVRERLDEAESERFADLANEAMCVQALDWVISTPSDEQFANRLFPPVGPLMQVCDGVNAASIALNETPHRLRPARLWQDCP